MLNIHLKIEAKKSVNLELICKVLHYSRRQTLETTYKHFNCDYYLLPYKVQKLSKRAKRNLI
jgi:hypothetical protein